MLQFPANCARKRASEPPAPVSRCNPSETCGAARASRKIAAPSLRSTLAFRFGGRGSSGFIKQRADQGTQGGFIFHPRVGPAAGGGTNHAFAIDHYHLRDFEFFTSLATKERVHVAGCGSEAERVGERHMVGDVAHECLVNMWSKGDGDGLVTARAEITLQRIEHLCQPDAFGTPDKHEFHHHDFAFETR